MTPALEQLLSEVRDAWRYRWIALALAGAAALAGWAWVFTLPDRYEATARIFVDTKSVLKPALQGLTNDGNADAQINYVRESLLEGPVLEQIAKDSGVLPATVTDPHQRESILTGLSNRITMTVTNAGAQGDERSAAGNLYDFQYLDSDRERALRFVDTMLNTFVERTLGGKRAGSEQAQKFLEAQLKDYEHRLSVAEDKLAAFKKKNVGLMPSDQGGFFKQLQDETDAEKKSETDLAIAVSRRDELTRQLRGDAAVTATSSPVAVIGGQGATAGDTASRILETQAKLDELLLKFTDKHPDVIAMRAALEELKQRRAVEMDSLRRGDEKAIAASGAGNSPVYKGIQLEINKQDVDIAALRRELAQHQQTVAELNQRLNSAPQVEAEFQQLTRDYDVNKTQYTALLDSYQKTRLGEQADSAGSVRFAVVLPPTATLEPVWPKRTKLLAEVLLGALALGAAAAYGLNLLRPVVSSVRGLNALTKFPVLGVVGIAFPSRHQAQLQHDVRRFSMATAGLLFVFAVVLALNAVGLRMSS